MASTRWLKQLMGCYRRGIEARRNAQPRDDNPYTRKDHYFNSNLQRLRAQQWALGWDSEEASAEQ